MRFTDSSQMVRGNKDKTIAGILALFFGGFGFHQFYLGNKSGFLYLLFFWTGVPAVVALVDAISLFMRTEENFDSEYNSNARYLRKP